MQSGDELPPVGCARRRGRPQRLAAALAVAALALAAPGAARGQAPACRRPLPDYDGRAPAQPAAGEVLAWVPRAVLFPATVAFQAFRMHFGAVVRTDLAARLFEPRPGIRNPTGRPAGLGVMVLPHAVFDAGMRPELGLTARLDRVFARRNRVLLALATGGERFYVAEAWDRVVFAGGSDVGLRARFWERPDNVYHGRLGPSAVQADELRFWMRRASAQATAALELGPRAGLHVRSGVRLTEFEQPAAPAAPPGQQPVELERYGALATDAELWVDSRGARSRPTSGVRAVARLHHGVAWGAPLERRWVVAEGQLGGYVEILRPGRVLGLELFAAAAEPLGRDGAVPFPELPTLGGAAPMRGFLTGRFRGETVAAASLLYRWPVWAWLEAEARWDVGNAFGRGFAELRPGALASSWTVAVRTTRELPARLELLVGLGSSRFDAPAFALEHARGLAALTRSF